MKKTIYKLLTPFITNDFSWSIIKPFALFGKNILFIREKFETQKPIPERIKTLFKRQIVVNGPLRE